MGFFDNYYYDDNTDYDCDSEEYEQSVLRDRLICESYQKYLKENADAFPKGLIKTYLENDYFEIYDFDDLEFNHLACDNPYIIIRMSYPNQKKRIEIKYIGVKAFEVNCSKNYFTRSEIGKLGIGVNEFALQTDNTFSHTIYFNSSDNISIHFSDIKITVLKK